MVSVSPRNSTRPFLCRYIRAADLGNLKAQGALHAGVLGPARLVQLAVDRALRLLTDGGAGSLALGADGLEESLGAVSNSFMVTPLKS